MLPGGVRLASYTIDDLTYLMARLRDPETGCPWDLRQTYADIVPYTIEECYELADTIERNDFDHLREELGDVLFQVVFYARLAEEDQRFSLPDVIDVLIEKLVRRHPHVFPDGSLRGDSRGDAIDEAKVKQNWESLKREERQAKSREAILDDIPLALPALTRARKLQKRASDVGFDWDDASAVPDKIREELSEIAGAIESGDQTHVAEEVGDLIFAAVNYARHLGVDPEAAVRTANRKFETRFRHMEQALLSESIKPESLDSAAWEHRWQQAKNAERETG